MGLCITFASLDVSTCYENIVLGNFGFWVAMGFLCTKLWPKSVTSIIFNFLAYTASAVFTRIDSEF